MAWTVTDLDSIKRAIATGARVVQYADKRMEYRSLKEMMQAKRMIEAELKGSSSSGSLRSHNPVFRKGL